MPKIIIKNSELIRSQMLKKGYNLKELGLLCGVSHSYISIVINGKRNPSGKLSKKILDSLDLKFDDIFFTS